MLPTNFFSRRKMLCRLLLLALAGQGLAVRAEDAIPTAFQKDRYESLRVRSPFAPATAVVAATPQASFAANWYVSGVARIGDDNFVTIKSRDNTTQFTLFANEPVGGVTLASVSWSDQVGKSTVVLCKGTETARLEFNEAQLRAPAATAGASPAPGGKAAMTVAGVNPRPAGVSMAAAGPNNGNVPPRRRSLPIPVPR
jgi:hypothetical protein